MPNALSRDPGLQPERTQLAWSRTLFLLAIDGVFFIRTGVVEHNILICLSGLLLLILLVAIKLYQYLSPDYFSTHTQRHANKLLGLVAIVILLSSGLLIADYLC